MDSNRYGECYFHRGKHYAYMISDRDVKLACPDCIRSLAPSGPFLRNLNDVDNLLTQQIQAFESFSIDKRCDKITQELNNLIKSVFNTEKVKNTRCNEYLSLLKSVKDSNYKDQKKLAEYDRNIGPIQAAIQESRKEFDDQNEKFNKMAKTITPVIKTLKEVIKSFLPEVKNTKNEILPEEAFLNERLQNTQRLAETLREYALISELKQTKETLFEIQKHSSNIKYENIKLKNKVQNIEEELEQEKKKFKQRLFLVERQNNSLKNNIEASLQDIRDKDNIKSILEREKLNIESNLKLLTQKNETDLKQLETLQKDHQKKSQELLTANQTIETLEKQIHSIITHNKDQKQRLQRQHSSQLKSQISKYQEAKNQGHKLLIELKASQTNLKKQQQKFIIMNQDFDVKYNSFQKDTQKKIRQYELQLTDLKSNVDNLKKKISDLQKSLLEEQKKLQQQIKKYQMISTEKQILQTKNKEIIKDLTNELTSQQGLLNSKQDQIIQKTNFINSRNKIISQKQQIISSLLSQSNLKSKEIETFRNQIQLKKQQNANLLLSINQLRSNLYFQNSQTAQTLAQKEMILNFFKQIKKNVKSTEFIYRSAKHKDHQLFHRQCDQVTNLLLIVKNNKNVFGGFTSTSLLNAKNSILDQNVIAFLFSLKHQMIFQLLPNKKPICYDTDSEPIFGDSDLRISSYYQGFSSLGTTFRSFNIKNYKGSQDLNDVLGGSQNFTIDVYEVYKITFQQ